MERETPEEPNLHASCVAQCHEAPRFSQGIVQGLRV